MADSHERESLACMGVGRQTPLRREEERVRGDRLRGGGGGEAWERRKRGLLSYGDSGGEGEVGGFNGVVSVSRWVNALIASRASIEVLYWIISCVDQPLTVFNHRPVPARINCIVGYCEVPSSVMA